MPIITIASSKGGPGKTTLAELIAGRLAAEGAKVAALDADPTGGLSRWATRGRGAWISTSNFSGLASNKNAFGLESAQFIPQRTQFDC